MTPTRKRVGQVMVLPLPRAEDKFPADRRREPPIREPMAKC